MDKFEELREQLEKEGKLIPDRVKPEPPIQKRKQYEQRKLSKQGVRRSLANWQTDNLIEFMETWNEIEDKAMKARLYLDSLNYTIGKIGSVDVLHQHTTTTLENKLQSMIEGKAELPMEDTPFVEVKDEEKKEEED